MAGCGRPSRRSLASELAHPLSADEVREILGPRFLVMQYTPISPEALMELLNVYAGIMMLVRSEKTFGHWVGIYLGADERRGGWDPIPGAQAVHVFDSYGRTPDVPNRWRPARADLQQDAPHLLEAVAGTGLPLIWDDTQFQDRDVKIQTCGRWAILRLLNQDKTTMRFRCAVQLGSVLESADEYVVHAVPRP